jgi:methylated-DNA-[protein]-cysteine S-methyltransferase
MHRAIRLLKKIPRGKVVTYKELARVCNTSPRAIGAIMAHNKHPERFPCYKVISSSGALGGYSGPGGIREKQKLLAGDGIRIKNGKADKKIFYTFLRGNPADARTQ